MMFDEIDGCEMHKTPEQIPKNGMSVKHKNHRPSQKLTSVFIPGSFS